MIIAEIAHSMKKVHAISDHQMIMNDGLSLSHWAFPMPPAVLNGR
jgi:ABC-type sugar transport system ATPase subunit